ncbi:gamma-glutamyltransferase family protein [Aliiroseovarius subalbicans]|uniref:gamma-glutamyltransferase family protein n=1 Tax=Aliiroseovarius subalbicans TaxID=2925840 RepID=UPI001F585ACB|nr:gamma-glutamyltransferase family protein [Aliiroseovarius subalbicans]MCI2400198.1 gamma-glutamyltransferase family protein [Aliiroseovarius subalbicans]
MRDFHSPGRSPVLATNGMCATSHPIAARTAIRVLEDGGNAVDAAIAAAAVLGIAEPHMTGLGGDCFVLLKPAGEDRVVALNGSGRAPAALNADALRGDGLTTMPIRDIRSVTVPGAVDAFCRLHADWGHLDLAEVLSPAIRYAKDGIPVAPRVAFDWKISEREGHLSGRAKQFYMCHGDHAFRAGQIFAAPGQADVLKRIAREGRAGFYDGPVAEDMVASLRAMGGAHTLEDFASTACNYTLPLAGNYKGTDLVEHPPNGQGATAILMNNIIAQFDVAPPWSAQRAHIEAEAAKLAYDARNRFIADTDHATRTDHMLAPETATQLAALIDPKRAMAAAAPLTESVHKDTVLLTVVDRDQMAVSLIYSIYHAFGSGLASDRFGLLFQNRGAGFTLEPGHPNEAGGGKRPMHTIIPGMLMQGGKVTMPFGVMGGAFQPSGHSRFVTNMVDHGLDAQAALDAPRCFSDAGELKVERGYSEAVRAELAEMGHTVVVPETPLGGGQAIRIDWDDGVLIGASDPRKDGCAIGY